MKTYGEIDMNDYDPQASLEAHEQFEAQRRPPHPDDATELRVLTFLVVMSLSVIVLTVLCLIWALQIS